MTSGDSSTDRADSHLHDAGASKWSSMFRPEAGLAVRAAGPSPRRGHVARAEIAHVCARGEAQLSSLRVDRNQRG